MLNLSHKLTAEIQSGDILFFSPKVLIKSGVQLVDEGCDSNEKRR
ncbi:hypothetical protein [Flavobacterium sp. T12S277]